MKALLLFALSAIVVGGRAAQPSAEGAVGVYQMSPFEVSAESANFQKWSKMASPNFVVYTDAGQKEAARVLRQFEMLRIAGQGFFRREPLKLSPIILVLPTEGSDWKKIASKSRVEWKAAASWPARRVTDLILAQYDWQSDELGVVRALAGSAIVERLNLFGPFWFRRGVGSFFETAEFTKDTIALGRANARSIALRNDGWLAWDRFFLVDGQSDEFIKKALVSRYQGQAAIFVQFLLTNPSPGWIGRLIVWTQLADTGRSLDEGMFKEVFGQDYQGWQKTMESYFNGGRYSITQIKLKPAALDFPVKNIHLPMREIRELFVLSQVLNQDVPESDAALDSILAKGLQSEPLRELLAEACLERNRRAEAVTELRKLIAAGSANPAIYARAAEARIDRAEGEKLSLSFRLGDEVEEVRTWCRQALALEPSYAFANELLAMAEAFAPEVRPDASDAIEKIYRALEGKTSTSAVLAYLAVAEWRLGKKDSARAVAEAVIKSLFSAKKDVELMQTLLAELQRSR